MDVTLCFDMKISNRYKYGEQVINHLYDLQSNFYDFLNKLNVDGFFQRISTYEINEASV